MTRIPQSGKTLHSVDEVLSDAGSSLGRLIRHARQMAYLESLLRDHVDPELADHFQVATARQNRLILVTPTAAWATRLRMHAPRLVTALQSAGPSAIEHIDIRVAPLSRETVKQRRRRPLSPAAKQALELMDQLGSKDKE